MKVVKLREAHLEAAAQLAAQRYHALRAQAPVLPLQYGERAMLLPLLQRLQAAGPGVVALQGSEVVGFLGAFPIPAFRGLSAVISPEWGNGARPDDDGRISEAMYTAPAPSPSPRCGAPASRRRCSTGG